jgi:threonine synthase
LAALELCVESTLSGKVAVAILTGHGLKDAEAVAQTAQVIVEPTLDAVLEVLS